MELQQQLLNLIKPANEREAYGDWAKSVMMGFHPTLWRQFQAEQSATSEAIFVLLRFPVLDLRLM